MTLYFTFHERHSRINMTPTNEGTNQYHRQARSTDCRPNLHMLDIKHEFHLMMVE